MNTEQEYYEKQQSDAIRFVSKKWPLSKFKEFVSKHLTTENDEDQWTFDYQSYALWAYYSGLVPSDCIHPREWAVDYYFERWNP